MKRILFLLAVLISMTVQSQIIYTFDTKTPVLPGDLLLGTDSATLQTSNFKVRDIGATLIDLYGIANDTTVFTTKNYGWISNEPDSIAVAFENLNTYAVNTHLQQTISGAKTFTSDVVINNGPFDVQMASLPKITFFDGTGEDIGLVFDPANGYTSLSPTVGTGGNILHQTNVSAGANVTITPTTAGISISSTQLSTINEGSVSITNTYSNLGISPGQFQNNFNSATDTQIGTNTSGISTNAGNISTNTGNISTNTGNISTNTGNISNKADKSNVLELDNATAFTPDADYEPATKKYVDDQIASGGKLVYSARIDKNGTSVTVTEYYNDNGSGSDFISSVSATTGTLNLFLAAVNSNWETELEIQGTANTGTGGDAFNRNPHFFFNDNTRISMYFVDSGGSAATAGAVWVRIYNWV